VLLLAAWAVPAHAESQPPSGTPDTAQREFLLGLNLDLGRHGHPDATRAFTLYLRAAQQGLPDAAFNVAVMYDSGRGTPHNAVEAALWYAAAAAAGNRRAAYNLGQLYEHGQGVPANPAMARAWYRRAAGQGVTAARSHLRDRMLRAPSAAAPPAPAEAAMPVQPGEPTTLRITDRPTVLIWQPATATGPTTYFIELTALTHGLSDIVFTADTDVSAIQTDAPLGAGDYAWRVFTVHEGAAHYTPSAWTRFNVVP
jgi:hypothetical protein